jgi:hypothetical protein
MADGSDVLLDVQEFGQLVVGPDHVSSRLE